jgi:two-component system OmpR family response regulator
MSIVLVVDDDPVSVQLLELILSRSGYEVIRASSAAAGLELVYSRSPDLVIIDDMMPGMSGGDMCQRIKNDPQVSHTPVILISAGIRVKDSQYLQNVGADYALMKPTLSKDVLAAVEAVLGSG